MFSKSVYEYSDYRSILRDYYYARKHERPNWSYGVWARQLGIRSPSTLIMILNGQRNPGKRLIRTLSTHFRFDKREAAYFEDLVTLHKVREDVRLSVLLMEKLGRHHPAGKFKLLDSDTFFAVSNWYYYAIRELVATKGFQEDFEWISRRLRFDVSPKQVKQAIETLLRLDLLRRSDDNALVQSGETVDTDQSVNDEGLMRYHEQTLDNAKKSIRRYRNDRERYVTGFTIPIKMESVPKAHELIEKFRMDMVDLMNQDQEKDAVYQLEIMFFSLTETGLSTDNQPAPQLKGPSNEDPNTTPLH